MGWPRTVTVTIDGVAHTTEAIDSVFVQRGRRSYCEGLQAGSARIILLDPATRPEIGDVATIDVGLDAGGTSRLFTGKVHAIAAQFDPFAGTILSIDCFGPLAKAGRRDQDDTLAVQLDGARIEALLESALAQQWAEQPLTQTWADVPATLTWADYGIDPTIIDPGLYDIAALTNVPTSTLGQLAQTMFSAGGVVYETGDGKVGYADSTNRQGAALGTPLDIPASTISAASGVAIERFDDIVNQVNLTWASGDVQYNAVDSVAEYGYVTRDYLTLLNDAGDAADFAERLAQLQAFPAASLEGPLLVRLNNVTDSLSDSLLQLAINDYLQVSSIPTGVLPGGVFYGFVEGVNYELTAEFANVEVYASDARYSIYETRWADIPDTLTWAGVDATLAWQDA